jgi:hypothetical protein
MSLAAFKAKSLTMYGNHSTKDGFSLNGPLRQPSLGENLGRSVTRTPFRGPAPMGHGMGSRCRVGGWRARTCGGTYPISIHRSCLGTPQTLVKRSTMNEKGLIETKYKGILHGTYPNTHVFTAEKEKYIDTIVREVLACPVQPYDYTQGSQKDKKVRCTPYTKTILDMNYARYYKIHGAACNQLDDPYKYPHVCGVI